MLTKPQQYLYIHIRKNRPQILIKGPIVFWISVVFEGLTASFQDHKILSLKSYSSPFLHNQFQHLFASPPPLYFIKHILGVLTVHHFSQPRFYVSDCCLFMEEVRDLFYQLRQIWFHVQPQSLPLVSFNTKHSMSYASCIHTEGKYQGHLFHSKFHGPNLCGQIQSRQLCQAPLFMSCVC